MPDGQLPEFILSEFWKDMIVKHTTIEHIATDADRRSMYLFEPMLQELFHRLLWTSCQRSLLVCMLRCAQLLPGFLLCLAIDISPLPTPSEKASYPSVILLVGIDGTFAFAASVLLLTAGF